MRRLSSVIAFLLLILMPLWAQAQVSSLANRNLEGLTIAAGALAVNVSKINGVTPLMGNGATGTGSLRVTVSSDNTPYPIKIDQTTPGTTNLVDTQARPADAACKTWTVNTQGVAGAPIVVDATAGGVTIAAASTTRCGVLIRTLSSGGDMLCAPTGITPTTTVGMYIYAGESLKLDLEAQQAMKCIRQGATSATVYVMESTT